MSSGIKNIIIIVLLIALSVLVTLFFSKDLPLEQATSSKDESNTYVQFRSDFIKFCSSASEDDIPVCTCAHDNFYSKYGKIGLQEAANLFLTHQIWDQRIVDELNYCSNKYGL